ncbi:DUF7557 family protein [Haladaptatus salinisoli]|uniref:DUF7557 family protein n=1 Tax=Haladaptatus salinisoli TaxID=2884876 RepID=UPI001D0A53CD|nr:hypothetical protein [Haladaptatus salinisoli]
MSPKIDLSEEMVERLDRHREGDETYEEFAEELLDRYEVEGQFSWEGYGGPP